MNFQYKAIVNGKNGIQVKVVADSINKYNQKRITTFELSYHRYIHGEVLTHRCLVGETKLVFDAPTKDKGGYSQKHTMSIKDFYNEFHNSFVFGMLPIRMLDTSTGHVRHTKVKDIWLVGMKPTYVLKAGEHSLRGTIDHPIYTDKGWVELGQLTEEHSIAVVQDATPLSGLTSIFVPVDSVVATGEVEAVYDLAVVDEEHNFVANNIVVHNCFSRNSSSSRAIPVGKMEATPVAVPIHWGKNQAGMKAKEELPKQEQAAAKLRWHTAMTEARTSAGLLSEYGLHKQVTNRLTEPFQMMRTVLTATELDNFFWLRVDEDAQPEIVELAKCMHQAMQESTPQVLEANQWHTPYVPNNHTEDKTEYFLWEEGNQRVVNEEEALMISASACGQVSYRNLNTSYDKAIDIYQKLVGGKKIHASPYEHQALCLSAELPVFDPKQWPHGVTHIDRDGAYWSGNFKGWVQHRQLFKGHTCNNFQLES